MLEKIFDLIIGFTLNRELEKKLRIRPKLLNGRLAELPSKLFDRFINFMVGLRYTYYLEMQRNMLKGGIVEIPSNIFDWKALERASGCLRVYMQDFHNQFKESYVGDVRTEDFKDWFRHFHIERPEHESKKKSVSEALLADDLPRV